MGPVGAPVRRNGFDFFQPGRRYADRNLGLHGSQRDKRRREVMNGHLERRIDCPMAVADQTPIVEVALDDHQVSGAKVRPQIVR